LNKERRFKLADAKAQMTMLRSFVDDCVRSPQ
jgi:hypothetical protein